MKSDSSPRHTDPYTTPAPKPGQKWHLPHYIQDGVPFSTLLGSYYGEAGETPMLENMSLHFWHLKPGDEDHQTPHKQDEAYYIVSGHGQITIDGRPHLIREGDLIFVPRCAPHHFHDFDQAGLVILIFFSPDFTGGSSPPAADRRLRNPPRRE